MVRLKDKPPYYGHYLIEIRDKCSLRITKSIKGLNVITYAGADLLARMVSGESQYGVNYLYGEHADPGGSGYVEGSLNGLSEAKTDTLTIMRTAPRSTTDAETPILFKVYDKSSGLYANNVVTYTAALNSDATNGRIYVGAGLVTRVGNNEILFAHSYFPGHIKLANHEILIHWMVTFF